MPFVSLVSNPSPVVSPVRRSPSAVMWLGAPGPLQNVEKEAVLKFLLMRAATTSHGLAGDRLATDRAIGGWVHRARPWWAVPAVLNLRRGGAAGAALSIGSWTVLGTVRAHGTLAGGSRAALRRRHASVHGWGHAAVHRRRHPALVHRTGSIHAGRWAARTILLRTGLDRADGQAGSRDDTLGGAIKSNAESLGC